MENCDGSTKSEFFVYPNVAFLAQDVEKVKEDTGNTNYSGIWIRSVRVIITVRGVFIFG